MKLASLLMEYLQTNRRLDLPGIGTFRIQSSHDDEKVNPKNLKSETHENISFENNSSIKEASGLVDFLASRTGKMRALLAADLDSHLTLAQEFLNIGKPFLFEGIGSLTKRKGGGYEFVGEKQKDHAAKEITTTSSTEESFTNYEQVFSPPKSRAGWKKPVIIFLMLAGFGAAIWLGYLAYKKRTAHEESAANNQKPVTIPPDSVRLNQDSLNEQKPITDDLRKFIIEVATERRAFERFGKLKSYGWDIQMETNDSTDYKLFLMLHVPAIDTTRVLDSLTLLNGRTVYIEK